ncbi:MAG: chromatin protein Cren7, partial [Acidilobaceae archaeon]
MPRKGKQKAPSECPECGSKAPGPVRTWTLVSPIPDREGRVTVTVMGAFVCPECGKTWNATLQKLKSGGLKSEGSEKEEGEPQIIEFSVEEL